MLTFDITDAVLMIIEGLSQVFLRFSSSKPGLKTVGSRFAALNDYENGSRCIICQVTCVGTSLNIDCVQVIVATNQGLRLRPIQPYHVMDADDMPPDTAYIPTSPNII